MFSRDPFPLDRSLFQVSKHDLWTIRDACEGVQVFGAPGSGKTSGPGAALATSFLSHGFGGLVLTAKKGERELWQKYATATNRTQSLRIFAPDQPWRFNFMDYEYRRSVSGGLTENLIALFSTVLEIAERRSSTHEQAYWKNTLNQLLRNAIDLVAMAHDRVNLPELYEVITSAPQSLEDVADPEWCRTSMCYACLQEAERRHSSGDRAPTKPQIVRLTPPPR